MAFQCFVGPQQHRAPYYDEASPTHRAPLEATASGSKKRRVPKAQNLVDVLHVVDLIPLCKPSLLRHFQIFLETFSMLSWAMPSEQGHGAVRLEVEGAEVQQHGSLPRLQDAAEAELCEAKAAATGRDGLLRERKVLQLLLEASRKGSSEALEHWRHHLQEGLVLAMFAFQGKKMKEHVLDYRHFGLAARATFKALVLSYVFLVDYLRAVNARTCSHFLEAGCIDGSRCCMWRGDRHMQLTHLEICGDLLRLEYLKNWRQQLARFQGTVATETMP